MKEKSIPLVIENKQNPIVSILASSQKVVWQSYGKTIFLKSCIKRQCLIHMMIIFQRRDS